jgi:hypothetical protein
MLEGDRLASSERGRPSDGAELRERYLLPLAELPELADRASTATACLTYWRSASATRVSEFSWSAPGIPR